MALGELEAGRVSELADAVISPNSSVTAPASLLVNVVESIVTVHDWMSETARASMVPPVVMLPETEWPPGLKGSSRSSR
jgi:hypothetical protein